MLLGKVVGTVVATQKVDTLEGLRFLLVRAVGDDLSDGSTLVVCADSVGAGVGEIVLFCQGSAARQTPVTVNRPVDGVVMAIVDQLSVQGEVRYTKE
jgi:ethanolamine utilization protein EutN